MNRSKVSIVIPTYNRMHSICDAVDSALAQTYLQREIIVVDDGSTDDTAAILKRYGDNIRYIFQENQGVSAARNRGITESSGEWVAFLDSDDIWMPDKLEKQVSAIRAAGLKVCLTGHEDDFGNKFLGFGERLDYGERAVLNDPLRLVLKGNYHPLVQSLLIDRALLMWLGSFDRTLAVAEDTLLISRIAFSCGLVFINEPLFVLRRKRTSSGLSDEKRVHVALGHYECYTRVQSEIYWRVLPKNRDLAKIVRNNIGYFLARQAEMYAVIGNFRQVRRYAFESLRYPSTLKTIVRCFVLIAAPSIAGMYFSKKWLGAD